MKLLYVWITAGVVITAGGIFLNAGPGQPHAKSANNSAYIKPASAASNQIVGEWRSESITKTKQGDFFDHLERYDPDGGARWEIRKLSLKGQTHFQPVVVTGRWYVSNNYLCTWPTGTNARGAKGWEENKLEKDRIVLVTSNLLVTIDEDGETNRVIRVEKQPKLTR